MFISRTHLIEVFFAKLALNLKSEVARTYLGYAWWLLEPALMVAVLYVVFSILLLKGTENFVVFLVCGKVPFLWFSKSVMNASNSIVAGKGLINQVSIPKPFFPLLVVFQDLFKQVFVFTAMFVFLMAYGVQLDWVWLSVIAVLFSQLMLISAAALVAAAITPIIPDFKYLLATGMMALMFASGIFYSYKEVVLPEHQSLFLMNPVANLIKNYRQVLMENSFPDWSALFYICLLSAAVIGIMLKYYERTDTMYARLITQ